MKGYAINPIITLAAMMWGVIPALMKPILAEKSKKAKTIGIAVIVFVTSLISSLILTTIGLVVVQGYNFYAIAPGRVIQFVILVPVYCVVTSLMYFSPLTQMVAESMTPQVLKNKMS